MKQIFNLPLKREGVEIMTYVADRLGYIKLLMGHLDLAIDLGKGWLVKKGPANAITRTILELFCSQVLEPTRCGHCFGIPINTIWSSAGFVNASSWKTGIYLKELSKMRERKIYLWKVLDFLNPGHRMGKGVGLTKSWCNQWSPPCGCYCCLTELMPRPHLCPGCSGQLLEEGQTVTPSVRIRPPPLPGGRQGTLS